MNAFAAARLFYVFSYCSSLIFGALAFEAQRPTLRFTFCAAILDWQRSEGEAHADLGGKRKYDRGARPKEIAERASWNE